MTKKLKNMKKQLNYFKNIICRILCPFVMRTSILREYQIINFCTLFLCNFFLFFFTRLFKTYYQHFVHNNIFCDYCLLLHYQNKQIIIYKFNIKTFMNRSLFQQSERINKKYNKVTNQENKREGDWICYFCNNLNYSFRENCNRCKNMSRMQNIELLKKKKSPQYQYNTKDPLSQVYFINNCSFQNSFKIQGDLKISERFTQLRKDEKIIVFKSNSIENQQNIKREKGFSSLLYLTPTRYSKYNCEEQDYEYDGYKSPRFLPSVSPLLRLLKLK